MFDGDYNIQCRPTPTLFEKLAARDLAPLIHAISNYALIASDLHGVIVNFPATTAGTFAYTYSLLDSLLRTVIVNLPTVSCGAVNYSYSLVSSVVLTVIKNFTTNPGDTPIGLTYSLITSELKLTVKDAGTYTGEQQSSYSLISSALV